jgi:acyl-CoA thioester hydrolase
MSRRQPNFPTIADLASLHEVPAGSIPDDHIDGNGHLSVRFIVELAAHGAHDLLVACGLTNERREQSGSGVFAAEHHLVYTAEIRGDANISVFVRAIDLSARSALLQSFVFDHGTGGIAAVLRAVVVSVDLASRTSTPFAADVASELERVVQAHGAASWRPPYGSWGRLKGARRRMYRRRFDRMRKRS